MNAVTASIAVAKRSPFIGVFLLLWGFLIGLSRVACGLHYVSDIIGGAIMAIPGNMAASQCHVVRFVSSIILALWDIKVSAKDFKYLLLRWRCVKIYNFLFIYVK